MDNDPFEVLELYVANKHCLEELSNRKIKAEALLTHVALEANLPQGQFFEAFDPENLFGPLTLYFLFSTNLAIGISFIEDETVLPSFFVYSLKEIALAKKLALEEYQAKAQCMEIRPEYTVRELVEFVKKFQNR